MLYWLHHLRESWGFLNVFQYITFRSGGAALTSLGLSLLLGPWVIEKLRRHKAFQTERPEGPSTHLQKQGTPTMGGILILASTVGATLLWSRWDSRFTWMLLFVTVALAAVGAWDDYLKLKLPGSKGAHSTYKFAVQLAVGFGVVLYLALHPPHPSYATHLSVPYAKEWYLELGAAYSLLGILMIVGSSNAVNLTDGLDGLAAGTILFCALTYAAFAYAAGHARFAEYLKIVYVEGAGEAAVYLAATAGACLGFLWFNAYPAQVFMGDTSSLFLGGAIATAALITKQELLLPIVGGVFVLETLSVILQMASYKLRGGRRIFRMAPLHHHFELSGIQEPKVTVRFWIVSVVLMLMALASLKIR